MKQFDTRVYELSVHGDYRYTVKNFTIVFQIKDAEDYAMQAHLNMDEMAAEYWKMRSEYLETGDATTKHRMEILERFATIDQAFEYDVADDSCCSW